MNTPPNTPLSENHIQHALQQFFTDPHTSKAEFFKMGAENTTALLEDDFGLVVLRVCDKRHE